MSRAQSLSQEESRLCLCHAKADLSGRKEGKCEGKLESAQMERGRV